MREILADTHLFLWSQFETRKIPPKYLALFQSDEVRWHLSQVSILEIQIKHDLGKLKLPDFPERVLPGLIRDSGFHFEDLSNDAIYMLGKLPGIHRDPFDRLLIATALVTGWEIATEDPVFAQYPVRLVQ